MYIVIISNPNNERLKNFNKKFILYYNKSEDTLYKYNKRTKIFYKVVNRNYFRILDYKFSLKRL